jgi:hypothetical protein
MFLVGLLFGFLPVYLYAIGYTPVQSGTLVSVATLSYLLVQPVAGWLADRVAVQVTVVVGLLLAALATNVVPFTSGVPLIITVVLAGIGIGTVWTNSDTLVSTLADWCSQSVRWRACGLCYVRRAGTRLSVCPGPYTVTCHNAAHAIVTVFARPYRDSRWSGLVRGNAEIELLKQSMRQDRTESEREQGND